MDEQTQHNEYLQDLEAYSKTAGDKEIVSSLKSLFNKKLWFQLSLKLRDLIQENFFSEKGGFKKLYQEFIHTFEFNISPLIFVEMCKYIVLDYEDLDEALSFAEKIKEKMKGKDMALVHIIITISQLRIRRKEVQLCKVDLDLAQKILSKSLSNLYSVQSYYYLSLSSYYHCVKDFNAFYKTALLYLGYTEISDLPEAQKESIAENICYAALLGKDVYNFGELLLHPITKCLPTSKQWLLDVILIFNSGNMNEYIKIENKLLQDSNFSLQRDFLKEKMQLFTLLQLAFDKPANKRVLLFSEIAKGVYLEEDLVEELIIKSFAFDLMKGSIDEVNQLLTVLWIQPRMLEKDQILSLANRITDWCKNLNGVQSLLEENAKEILHSVA